MIRFFLVGRDFSKHLKFVSGPMELEAQTVTARTIVILRESGIILITTRKVPSDT